MQEKHGDSAGLIIKISMSMTQIHKLVCSEALLETGVLQMKEDSDWKSSILGAVSYRRKF